jgi:DNA-binding response OmpR family regulator
MPRTVLIADRDPQILNDLATYFASEPFAVLTVGSAAEARAAVLQGTPSLVVAGTEFADAPPLDLARWILARAARPRLIVLCERADPVDRTIGLELGADDCMSKPVFPRELLARIRSVMRRADEGCAPRTAAPVQVQGYSINLPSRLVTLPSGGTAVLSVTEARVLETLIAQRGAPVSREELSRHALGRPWNPEERALDQHVASLRRKLFVPTPLKPLIHTVRNVGYTIDRDEARPDRPRA